MKRIVCLLVVLAFVFVFTGAAMSEDGTQSHKGMIRFPYVSREDFKINDQPFKREISFTGKRGVIADSIAIYNANDVVVARFEFVNWGRFEIFSARETYYVYSEPDKIQTEKTFTAYFDSKTGKRSGEVPSGQPQYIAAWPILGVNVTYEEDMR